MLNKIAFTDYHYCFKINDSSKTACFSLYVKIRYDVERLPYTTKSAHLTFSNKKKNAKARLFKHFIITQVLMSLSF